MIQLFLSEPNWGNEKVYEESSRSRISLLDELEATIWSVISSRGRSEARLWLCNAIGSISSISPRDQRDLCVSLLRAKPVKWKLVSQLLQLIFEKQPQKVGHIIAKKSHKLDNFFKGNPRRILQWFSNFSGTDDMEHRKGAKALSKFAFVNRDICWEELEWKGKHGQSPAMVATKPHYFLDLDVQQTVENFIEYVPEFWSSNEFSESLKDGSILSLDTKFFIDLFTDLMYKDDSEEVWEVIEDFVMEQSFSFLCHHLLIILDEKDLQHFLDLIPKYIKEMSESDWLVTILSKYSHSCSIDLLLLLNAVTNQGRQVMRVLNEEGTDEEKEKTKRLVFQLCESSNSDNGIAPVIDERLRRKPLELIKRLGLQSWVIHYTLSEEFLTPEYWETLFINNGIKFRKSDKFALLQDEFSKGFGSDSDGGFSARRKRKKHNKHKKHRKKHSRRIDSEDENEFREFDFSSDRLNMQSKAGDWLLSTDSYSTTWSSVDLPEHLSKHCFSTWLKWVFDKGR